MGFGGPLNLSIPLIDSFLAFSILSYSVYLSLRVGMFSVIGVVFWAAGGYFSANLLVHGWNVAFAILLTIVFSCIGGAMCAAALVRLRRLYLGMATFALVLLVGILSQDAITYTGNGVGLFGMPAKISTVALMIIVAVVALTIWLSELGMINRTLEALRLDEELTSSVGISVTKWRMYCFIFSAGLGGLAGAVNVLQSSVITPDAAGFSTIVNVLEAVVIGGTGAWYGPLLGSFVIIWLPGVLTSFGEWETVAQSLIVIVIVIYFPSGAVGLVRRVVSWVKRRSTRSRVEPLANEQDLAKQ